MIITGPALIAIKSSTASIKRSASRRTRLRFWAKQPSAPKFGTEAYYATQRVVFPDADLAAGSGGARIHAQTRNSTHRG